jgi:hypothetical protein
MRCCSASKSNRSRFQMTASPSRTTPGGNCSARAAAASGRIRVSSLPCLDHSVTLPQSLKAVVRKPSHLGSAHRPPGSALGPGKALTSFARATATGGCSAGGRDSAMGPA